LAVTFPKADWQGISLSVQDLVLKILSKDYGFRPSALECLAHPWVKKFYKNKLSQQPIPSTTLDKLKIYHACRKLQEIAFKFISITLL
jgi:serine/threonine protein kinase